MQDFPGELLFNIFSFIPKQERIAAALTCRKWHLVNESVNDIDKKVHKLKTVLFKSNNLESETISIDVIIDEVFANKDQAVAVVKALKKSCPEFDFFNTKYDCGFDLYRALPELICISEELAKGNGYKIILNDLLEAQIFTIDKLFLELNISSIITNCDRYNPNLCSYMLENINKLTSLEICLSIDEEVSQEIVRLVKLTNNYKYHYKLIKTLSEAKALIAQQIVLLCDKKLDDLEKINNNNNKIYPVFEWKFGGNSNDNASDDKPDSKRRKLFPGS